MKYKLTKEALSDIKQIWIYTKSRWSIEQADRYYDLIINEFILLTNHPLSGVDKGYIREGYRMSKVKSHLVFYKIGNEGIIEIIRILHQSMDIEKKLK